MKLIKPHSPESSDKNLKIFLAGTIDMGHSRDWQSEFASRLKSKNVTIFNPRRDDNKGVVDFSNKKEIHYQIQWELAHLDNSDIIIFNLLPESKSPISLMEIGLYANSDKGVFVICPKNYYRYDNVFLVCAKYKIPIFHSENDFWKTFDTLKI